MLFGFIIMNEMKAYYFMLVRMITNIVTQEVMSSWNLYIIICVIIILRCMHRVTSPGYVSIDSL